MKLFDFTILMTCCFFWAANFVVTVWALGHNPIPPFMLGAIRAMIVLAVMGIFLFRERPKNFGALLIVCACVGPLHLALLYTGLQTAPASGGSIVAQMMIPMTTVMSVIFLKERLGRTRTIAIVGAFIGVMIMIFDPESLVPDIGMLYILLAYVALAVASIVMKRVGEVDWRVYVAWMALMLLVVMIPASYFFEEGQKQVWDNGKGVLLIAATYAALAVTIFAHGQYFNLILKYPVTTVVPLTLVMPVFTCIFGVWLLDEALLLRYLIGAAIILPCVYIIAKRQTLAPVQED